MAAQTNFIDIATIWLHAGKGGDGAVSFHREKFVAAGGPDGGDGGRGGDIIFVADDHLSTLMDFRYKRKYVAPEGGKGGASLCHGKNAENLVIKVPLGTVIKDAESGLVIAGQSPDGKLVEIVELPRSVHPWFVAVQFHPEFKSRPNRSHPLFKDFIRASLEQANK